MCVNVAFDAGLWVNNQGQRLAGTGVFVSRVKGRSASYDEPRELRLCRLHFVERHRGGWGELPREFPIAISPMGDDWTVEGCSEDVVAFKSAVMADTPLGRGFWKCAPWHYFRIPPYPLGDEDAATALEACTQGQWAFVLPQAPIGEPVIEFEEDVSLGGWDKDGYGCHLSYAIPVGSPIELAGRFEPGPSGLIYQVGSLEVKIPLGTEWALWLRCSDTGAHSGFTVVKLEWGDHRVWWRPVMVSLFGAPHDFPASGYFFDPEPLGVPAVGKSLAGAIALAEHIASHGFTPPKREVKPLPRLEFLADAHARGEFGLFGM
jgi:hypothetical protein